MKIKILTTVLVLLSLGLFAQVGVNTDGADPDGSAMLDVKSTDKGMLVPRMSTAQRTAISSPATGLLVFDETTGGFWFYNGSIWEDLSEGDDLGNHTATQSLDMNYNDLLGAWSLNVRRSDNADSSDILFQNGPDGTFSWRMTNLGAADGTSDFIIAGGNASANQDDLIERIRFAENGNVGIGTSSPAQKLHVSGAQMRLRISDLMVADSDWDILPQTNNTTKLFRIYDPTVSADRLVINSTGYVGIGTITPGQKLHLYHTDGDGQIINQMEGGATTRWSTTGATPYIGSSNNYGFSIVTNNAYRITADTLGNVGINTTTPDNSAQLEVNSTTKGFLPPRMTSAQRTAISSPATGLLVFDETTDGFWFYNGTIWEDLSEEDDLGNHTATQNLNLNGNYLSGDGDNEGVFVNDDGQVAVGSNGFLPGVDFRVAGTTTPISSVQDGGHSIVGMQAVGNSLKFGRLGGQNLSGLLFIEGTGNVGIGTTTPASSAKLEINSTTSGFLPPRMTVMERMAISSPATGSIIYNTNTNKPNYYNGTEWLTYDGTLTRDIGDYYQGGIIFYLDNSGGGLICAVSDQTAEWGCSGTPISGADGTAIGTGLQNTIDIEAGCTTSGIAADVCANLSLNGYTDWFLPSKDELNEMYTNKAAIDAEAIANGGSAFVSTYYWSSSEYDNNNAWVQLFSDGYQPGTGKHLAIKVRAVRAF